MLMGTSMMELVIRKLIKLMEFLMQTFLIVGKSFRVIICSMILLSVEYPKVL